LQFDFLFADLDPSKFKIDADGGEQVFVVLAINELTEKG
jgi:hypothetical protein